MEKEILLHIGGMTCVNCQNKIDKTLRLADGIIRADVSYNSRTAEIVYDTEKIRLSEIIAHIEKLDYTVLTNTKKQKPDITRMVCMLVHHFPVCDTPVHGYSEPAGSQSACGYHNGLWYAVRYRSYHLCPLYCHVRRHQSHPVSPSARADC